MRIFILVLFSIISLHASAGHLLGGEITWKCVGNNQIVLSLELYRDCSGIGLSASTTLNSTVPGHSSISMSRVSITDLSPSCHTNAISCGSISPGLGAIEKHSYQSSPISIPPNIPASGFSFSFDQCCRSINLTNISNPASSRYYLKSVLYSGGVNDCSSPEFLSYDVNLSESHSLSFAASKPLPGDSLYYSLYTPLDNANSQVSFETGYSVAAPVPNPQTHSANAPVSINHQTGLLKYNISSAMNGLYGMGVKVECWRNSRLIAVVRRDISVAYNSTSGNTIPFVSVDTANSQLYYSGGLYKAEVLIGDTLQFRMDASDLDQNSVGGIMLSQEISFEALGAALDTSWGGSFNFQNPPSLAPVAPQTGFINSTSNNVEFTWAIDSNHLQNSRTDYFFNFKFHDDACDYHGKANLSVKVTVRYPAEISPDTVALCSGDSVQLYGSTMSNTYTWFPNLEISDIMASDPWVYPSSSRYYYLEDPQNPGVKDSVYVEVESRRTFSLDSVNAALTLTDSVQTGTRVWYYNGVPFSYPHDALTPFGPGQYWVVLSTANCKYITDTLTVSPGGSFSVADPNAGTLAETPVSVAASWGVSFELNPASAGYLNTIYLPGIDLSGETAGDSLQLQLYDDAGNLLWAKDTSVTHFSEGVFQMNLRKELQANTDYILSVSGDTGFAFHYFKDVQVPATPWNNGITVNALYEGPAGDFPSQPTDKFLPLVLQVQSSIGLNDFSASKVKIYPNPARDRFYVEGLEKGKGVQLLDVQGKLLREVKSHGERMSIERGNLPAGVYFLRLETGKNAAVQKLMFR